MKQTIIGAAMLAAVSMGCDDATGPATQADLMGTWNASAYVITNAANTAQTVDLVSQGMAFSISFTETTMSGVITFPGEDGQETFSGTYALDGDQITFTEAHDDTHEDTPEIFTIVLDGDSLTINSLDERYDFDGDGEDEMGTAVITLSRQEDDHAGH